MPVEYGSDAAPCRVPAYGWCKQGRGWPLSNLLCWEPSTTSALRDASGYSKPLTDKQKVIQPARQPGCDSLCKCQAACASGHNCAGSSSQCQQQQNEGTGPLFEQAPTACMVAALDTPAQYQHLCHRIPAYCAHHRQAKGPRHFLQETSDVLQSSQSKQCSGQTSAKHVLQRPPGLHVTGLTTEQATVLAATTLARVLHAHIPNHRAS